VIRSKNSKKVQKNTVVLVHCELPYAVLQKPNRLSHVFQSLVLGTNVC
jgi:hypothetical protein